MTNPVQTESIYRLYLIRFWRRTDTDRWHVAVRTASTGAERVFPDLMDAFAYLEQQLRNLPSGKSRLSAADQS